VTFVQDEDVIEAVTAYGAEQAFAPTETQLAVCVGDHRQLLSQREDLQVKDGPASEQASQGGEEREEDRFHPLDATARG